ncbi:hypothetical protein GDO86_007142 [Hymenochirus boettgeri]|uniref:H15 domain-containing protein n=1 Tax=Hymenochirus boettgeri TaxID=247094 RepID=A0A8T2IY00_9PIPI|nr:hypothetical protein GDO86_007142 [Hymenochirus boettgeri]
MEQKKASSSSGKRKEEEPAGQYSQLVVDTSAVWARENGSSLAKIYSEAKKVSWFDQQNGRTYLKYSIRALVQNDTLVPGQGVGANGSFRLNKKSWRGSRWRKSAAGRRRQDLRQKDKRRRRRVRSKRWFLS